MMTQQTNTDVIFGRKMDRTGPGRMGTLLMATGAAIVLLLAGSAAGADDMAPATAPATDAPTTAPMTAPMIENVPAAATAPAADAPAPMTDASTSTVAPMASDSVTTATAATQPTTRPSLLSDGVGADGIVKLTAGRSTVLTSRVPLKRISVASPDVADANPIAPTNVLVTAKKAGNTQLILWDDQDHSQIVDIDVEVDLQALKHQLKSAFPNLEIQATPVNDSIALRGLVPSQQVAEQVVEITAAFGKVHNFLEISGGQQVMLQVRFAEVSKTAVRNLGVTFGGTDGISSFGTNTFGSGTTSFAGATPALGIANAAAGGGVQLFGQGRFATTAFDYFISALRTNGLVRVLAEPNLIAINGQTASFLAGGQVPIPVPQPGNGGSTITIEYHDYGVQLNFTPLLLGNGRIRLKVSPEVSDLDYSVATSVGTGPAIPGFTDRKLTTTVELADGQSFALAGLLNNKISASTSAIPLLGDLPVLGQLFRSIQYTRSETELVVLVTPRLVEPMNPDQTAALPGEHWRYPTGPQVYLFNDFGGPVGHPGEPIHAEHRSGPAPQFHGSYGFSTTASGSAQPQ